MSTKRASVAPPPTVFGAAVQAKTAAGIPAPTTRFAPPAAAVQRAVPRRNPAPPPTRFGAVVQAKPAAANPMAPPPTRFGAATPSSGTAQRSAGGPPPPTRFGASAVQARLQPPAQSSTVQPMWSEEPYGGGHSKKIFIVKKDWKKKFKKKSDTKLNKMYYDDDTGISGERDYDAQRAKQMLRWLCSVVFKAFPAGVEIQAYFHTNGSIYLSSNTNAVNKKIVQGFNGGVLSALTDYHNAGFTSFDEDFQDRIEAHGAKLLSDTLNTGQEDVWAALKNNRIVVPPETYKVDLHAERRIQRHLNIKLDPDRLGGVKRACGVCAVALELTGEVNVGPVWPSASALGGLDKEDVIDELISTGSYSHVTRSKRTGGKTTNYDTDSDSDTDDYN